MMEKIKEKMTTEEMATRVAIELRDGNYVNLGIGLPMRVSDHVPEGLTVIFQAENGVLGIGPYPEEGDEDPDLGNAGDQDITVMPGACFFDSAQSFDMIRGGHLDMTVLGAFQVSEKGDLANWKLPGRKVGSYGGALDLATGAKKVVVLMKHVTREEEPRIVKNCTYPLTGIGCVNTIVTDIAVIDVERDGLKLREVAPGWSAHEVEALTEADLDTNNTTTWKR